MLHVPFMPHGLVAQDCYTSYLLLWRVHMPCHMLGDPPLLVSCVACACCVTHSCHAAYSCHDVHTRRATHAHHVMWGSCAVTSSMTSSPPWRVWHLRREGCKVLVELVFKLLEVLLVVPCCHLLWVSFPSYEEVYILVHIVVASPADELVCSYVTDVPW